MKRVLNIAVSLSLAIIIVILYYYYRWKPLWSLEKPKAVYHVAHHQDDTLRIAMIGDSWVGMRTDTQNNLLQAKLSEKINRPVMVKTKGKGGEKSRGIYHLMFTYEGFGTKPLIEECPDYCVVIAGINDAAANFGWKYHVYYMNLIINLLLGNGIRPILIEIPNVNIWSVYRKKPIKDLTMDYMRSLMTGCGMYHYSEYREALLLMLKDDNIIDSVLYVPMRKWNGDGVNLNRLLFMDDQIHLNKQGYMKMDSCIIMTIQKDLKIQ